jgi:hypothetical protein
MKSELREMATSLKNQVFTANMKFIKILDPAVALRSLAEDDIWESDPVHPSDEAYDVLAQHGLRTGEQAAAATSKKRPRADSVGSPPRSTRRSTAADSRGPREGQGGRGGHGGHGGDRGDGGIDGGNSGNRGRGLIRGRRGFSFGAVDVRLIDLDEGMGGGDRGNNSGYYGGGRGGGRGGARGNSLGGYYKKRGNYYNKY